MGLSVKVYKELDKLPSDIKEVLLAILDEMDNSVKREDFRELKLVVAELAEAQKRTEERLEALTVRVDQLVEAQKRTEERLNELAEAQKKTEETLHKVIERVDNIEVQLGGLSMAVGYGIEDKLYPYIDNFVRKVFDVEPIETMLRYHLEYGSNKFDEINIYTECKKKGKNCLVIGECKAQIGKKDIDRFIKMCERVHTYTKKEVFKYIVGYTFTPEIEKYIKNHYPELKYFKTYEIEHGKF